MIDGDTLVVRLSRDIHVRLLGCAAPETRTRDKAEKAAGLAAKRMAEQLVAESDGRIILDIPTGDPSNPQSPIPNPSLVGVQTLERFLARVHLPDGRDLAATLIAAGLARSA